MQGQGRSVSALGTTTSDSATDFNMSWNVAPTSSQYQLPERRMSSSETDVQYVDPLGQGGLNCEWSTGESSSVAAQRIGDHHNQSKSERMWRIQQIAAPGLGDCHLESSNILSLDSVGLNENVHQMNGSSLLQISGVQALSQDLNMISEFGDGEDNDCQIVDRPITYISTGSRDNQLHSTGNSFGLPSGFGGGYEIADGDRPGSSLDGQHISRKRKALEMNAGQSSSAGSNLFQPSIPSAQIIAGNTNTSINNLVIGNGSRQVNPRLGLSVGGAVPICPLSLNPRTNAEGSRRNVRLRINSSHPIDPLYGNPFSTEAEAEAEAGSSGESSSRRSSRLVVRNQLLDLNPSPTPENGSLQCQPVPLHVPSIRRNPQSRWSGSSFSRAGRPPSSSSGGSNAMIHEDSVSRMYPRAIPENPMFLPAQDMGRLTQRPTNLNLAGGRNTTAQNIASSSWVGSSPGNNSSPTTLPHRNYPPQYPQRLSELVRRSRLSSNGLDSGGQSSNHGIELSSATPVEIPLPSESSYRGRPISSSRSALLERHLDAVLGMPHLLRGWTAAGEGRSSVMSEIRHVLDLMRRGEALGYEDMMVLNQSVFFGMADAHDRHRDMRLDVDNMSYEELLALEERIGNVCTGLKEDTITKSLKRLKYSKEKTHIESEAEPCSICREEYNDGEALGILDCGHDFHRDCIKQWLLQKNLCPICKTPGLAT